MVSLTKTSNDSPIFPSPLWQDTNHVLFPLYIYFVLRCIFWTVNKPFFGAIRRGLSRINKRYPLSISFLFNAVAQWWRRSADERKDWGSIPGRVRLSRIIVFLLGLVIQTLAVVLIPRKAVDLMLRTWCWLRPSVTLHFNTGCMLHLNMTLFGRYTF